MAVIAEVSVEAAATAIGKKGATSSKDLAKGLQALGFTCPTRCRKYILGRKLPDLAIGHLTDPNRRSGWHWVVIDGDKIYDGISGNPDGTVNWKPEWRITSYLPVTK